MAGITFGNVVLCEDVREEKRNKNTLVGVYSGDILVSTLPAMLQLAFFFEYKGAKNGDRLDFEVQVVAMQQKATINIENDKTSGNIVVPRTVIKVDREGEIKVSVSINNGSAKTLLLKKLSVGHVEP